jgi:hypothetical protein
MPAKTRSQGSKIKKPAKRSNGKNGRSVKARATAGNLDKLMKAGVFDMRSMSPRHRKLIDSQLTAAEVDALIKAKKLLSARGQGPWMSRAGAATM